MLRMNWLILAISALISGCANSPPRIAPALLEDAPTQNMGIVVSVNILNNFGKTGYEDTTEVERFDGRMVLPTYENLELNTKGMIWVSDLMILACSFPNFQAQPYAGLHWKRRTALGYFPTFTLSGRKMLHGVQLDLNGFDRVFLAASLYQENYPSIIPNAGLAEAGPVKTFTTASIFLNIPWRVGKGWIWMMPNYRRTLEHPSLKRYGLSLAYAGFRRDFSSSR